MSSKFAKHLLKARIPILIILLIFAFLSITYSHSKMEPDNKLSGAMPAYKALQENSSISLLSYNLGLIRLGIPFIKKWEFTPFLEERLAVIPSLIKAADADIVALQEIYELEHQNQLIASLADIYPYSSKSNIRRPLFLADGLLVLSKYPITDVEFTTFSTVPFLERIFVIKGYLSLNIKLNESMTLKLVNTHLTAGANSHPESKEADAARHSEIEELRSLDRLSDETYVFVGDFNTGTRKPDGESKHVSKGNFDFLLSNGWESAYDQLLVNGKIKDDDWTWDIKNPLNMNSPHATSPSQRIDHVVLPPKTQHKLSFEDARIVFQEKVVEIKNEKEKVTASDHHGLLVVLRVL